MAMKKHLKPHLTALFMHVWMVSILYCTKGSRSEPEGGRILASVIQKTSSPPRIVCHMKKYYSRALDDKNWSIEWKIMAFLHT